MQPPARNATDLLAHRARAAGAHVAFEVRRPGEPVGSAWRQVTTREFEREVRDLAKGLIAAGLQPGDALAIMAPTSYEWTLADLATWYAGAVVVPIYETSAVGQVAAMLADAEVRLGIAGDRTHADLLAEGFRRAGIDSLGIWTMTPDDGTDLADLVARGAPVAEEAVEERRLLAGPDSVATIVYTSGTTAAPKGALITHGNFVGKVRSVAGAYTEVVRPDGNTIIFLPLAHVLARGLQLICLANGMRIAHLADPKEVVPALAALRPTFLVVVPRVLQKIQAAAAAAAARKHLGRVWAAAQRAAVEWGRHLELADTDPGRRAAAGLRLRHAIFDRLFYSRLRALMGGRVNYLLSGAAALDAELALFYRGLGVPILEGYGLTETTAPLTGNLPGAAVAGTVGVALPGTELRLDGTGEVLARGVGVFIGYRDASQDEAAFTPDGWFRTGDLGSLDEGGRLTLRGRIKDVIVTSGGKTITPSVWEGYVETDPLVAHAVVVGEGKPYLGGLVLLDPESVPDWAAREGIDVSSLQLPAGGGIAHVQDTRLVAAIGKVIAGANAQLARSEHVRRFAVLLADLSEAGGIITPTMKLKRAALTERVRHVVEGLYPDASTGK